MSFVSALENPHPGVVVGGALALTLATGAGIWWWRSRDSSAALPGAPALPGAAGSGRKALDRIRMGARVSTDQTKEPLPKPAAGAAPVAPKAPEGATGAWGETPGYMAGDTGAIGIDGDLTYGTSIETNPSAGWGFGRLFGLGMALTVPLAMGLSYQKNKSIPWALLTGITPMVAPAYVVYRAVDHFSKG